MDSARRTHSVIDKIRAGIGRDPRTNPRPGDVVEGRWPGRKKGRDVRRVISGQYYLDHYADWATGAPYAGSRTVYWDRVDGSKSGGMELRSWRRWARLIISVADDKD